MSDTRSDDLNDELNEKRKLQEVTEQSGLFRTVETILTTSIAKKMKTMINDNNNYIASAATKNIRVDSDTAADKTFKAVDESIPGSFLGCSHCGKIPSSRPLFGCEQSHILCSSCRSVGVSLQSCSRCGSQDLSHHLTIAEELLNAEMNSDRLTTCPYIKSGCSIVTSREMISAHREVCLFRPVECPKTIYSKSCKFIGPFCTIQQHGRDSHKLHVGVTQLDSGLITSKMFDKGLHETRCEDRNNAKFHPLELVVGGDLFYCYFERVAERGLWFFFVRLVAGKDEASKFKSRIMLGEANLDRNSMNLAELEFRGKVANYDMTRDEIKSKGMALTVADEVLRSFKVENILFRVWFKVEKVLSTIT